MLWEINLELMTKIIFLCLFQNSFLISLWILWPINNISRTLRQLTLKIQWFNYKTISDFFMSLTKLIISDVYKNIVNIYVWYFLIAIRNNL